MSKFNTDENKLKLRSKVQWAIWVRLTLNNLQSLQHYLITELAQATFSVIPPWQQGPKVGLKVSVTCQANVGRDSV